MADGWSNRLTTPLLNVIIKIILMGKRCVMEDIRDRVVKRLEALRPQGTETSGQKIDETESCLKELTKIFQKQGEQIEQEKRVFAKKWFGPENKKPSDEKRDLLKKVAERVVEDLAQAEENIEWCNKKRLSADDDFRMQSEMTKEIRTSQLEFLQGIKNSQKTHGNSAESSRG